MSDRVCAQLNFTSPGWMRLSRNLMRSRNSPSSSSSRAPIILSQQISTTTSSQVHILQSSSLTGQFKGLFYSVLLLYSSLLIIPHRANQPAFSTLSLYFTHHPSQGKSASLFYSFLTLPSPYNQSLHATVQQLSSTSASHLFSISKFFILQLILPYADNCLFKINFFFFNDIASPVVVMHHQQNQLPQTVQFITVAVELGHIVRTLK